MSENLRFAILGAARIAPAALVQPAANVEGAEVLGIAARDRERAASFAREHGVPRVYPDYAAAIDDPDVDVVYNPLPNGLHYVWTLRALRAGKHVLCEKPMGSNAAEVEEMVALAETCNRVLIEAYHWRYHPMAARIREIVRSGELGALEHVEARFDAPIPEGDIRFDYALAGGATMDLGGYAIQWARYVAEAEPEVVSATAVEDPARIDREMVAQLRFPAGFSGQVSCSMMAGVKFRAELLVRGSDAEMHVSNPLVPQFFNKIVVSGGKGPPREETVAGAATYDYQLAAVVAAIRDGVRAPTSGADSIANIRVIDACYRFAGLGVRGSD